MQNNKNKGFTIIEVLISAVILAIGLIAVTTSLLTTSKLLTESEEDLIAYNKAAEKLDELRNASFSTLEGYLAQPNGITFNIVENGNNLLPPIRNSVTRVEIPVGIFYALKTELPNEADYGVDINGDGVMNVTADINGNGNSRDNPAFAIDIDGSGAGDSTGVGYNIAIPIVVVIRWQGQFGPKVYTAFTMITRQD